VTASLGTGLSFRDLRPCRDSPLGRIVRSSQRLRGRCSSGAAAVAIVAVPGWRVDPTQRYAYRYHDGAHWTVYVADPNAAGIDDPFPGQTPPVFPVGRALAGWWPDPSGQHRARYHDGNGWTMRVAGSDRVAEDQSEPLDARPGSNPPRRKALIWTAGTVVTALIGTLIAYYVPVAVESVSQPEDLGVEVVGLDVRDHTSTNPTPALDVSLRNVGGDVAFLTQVTLTVVYAGVLAICEAGGGGHASSSFTYPVKIPMDAETGDQVESRISQELRPNTVDRFMIRVGLDGSQPSPDWIDPETGDTQPIDFYVYIVDLSLTRDGTENFDAGRAALLIPLYEQSGDLEDYSPFLVERDDYLYDDPCYQQNRAVLDTLMEADDISIPPKLGATQM
jgi:Protein of unknown function (DUF2510)